MLAFLGLSTNAQFLQFGVLAGGGFGGLKGEGLTVKAGINPEFGMLFRYNMTEKISIRTFITVDIHSFTLTGGRQVATNTYGGVSFQVQNGADYSFNSSGASQHVDITYIAIEDILDLSGGVFWGIRFPNLNLTTSAERELRVFYNATDAEILAQSNGTNSVFYTTNQSESNITPLYASDQIKRSLVGIQGGVYAAVTGGTKKIKGMLRYDLGLKNLYKDFSTTNKLKENYFRIGLIYMLN